MIPTQTKAITFIPSAECSQFGEQVDAEHLAHNKFPSDAIGCLKIEVKTSSLVKTATTTKPTSTVGENAAVTIGEYKPINEPGSTELLIQDNDNTDPMVTDQHTSTLEKTASTTKPTSTVEDDAAGRLLTITMGFICTVSCVILIYKAAPILHQVQNMELSLADGKITRKEVKEQLNDAFTIEMSDEDGEKILTEGVITIYIPPNCHLDIIN
ncbi:unnamed protein product [Mytilus coruscus]|uniref:Uncharacterized protein n=1 Tax=Mytilus coruscus TaxID=42192 RepID=A0A6J8ELQ3_MYTCO|nr:unnamed protein product [Mytilus coruscus]